ncbi:MAG: hypothetical protein ACW963_05450, partial [Candidatus Sifarchaeia archaeon]
GWGTLKAGDEMQWQSDSEGTAKMKVINIVGDVITLEVTVGGNIETEILDADATITELNFADVTPWLIPKLLLEEEYRWPTQNYEWQGTTYKAYYSELSRSYYDFNTGILFEKKSSDGTVTDQLVSTNADLAEASGGGGGGGCLGTLLIALVSVTMVISYSVLRKKKK